MDYELGLQKLKAYLEQYAPGRVSVLAVLEDRFEKNKRFEQVMGSSENTRHEHAQIIFALNELALQYFSISFNELCQGKNISHSKTRNKREKETYQFENQAINGKKHLIPELERIGFMKESASDNFDVFLCHNSDDKPTVRKICKLLRSRGLSPWLDEEQLRPGYPWQRVLEESILNIEAVAVFVGNTGMGPWQNMELEAYLRKFVSRGSPVIPVILDYAPERPELPTFLGGMTWVDFRQTEPDPLQQLIWGITGKRK